MFVKLYNICNSPAALEGWKERRKEYYEPHHVKGERRSKIMDDIIFCVVVLSFIKQKLIVRCK